MNRYFPWFSGIIQHRQIQLAPQFEPGARAIIIPCQYENDASKVTQKILSANFKCNHKASRFNSWEKFWRENVVKSDQSATLFFEIFSK